ncbi:hypothetical protein GCM10010306_062500 [Streptomyces umbrinus]|nr:hypothetical protein GCM10010306_062500 [Streptomyces umbrinus]
MARGADAVMVCVHSDEQVQEVCLAGELLDTLPTGAVVVVHTTGSPRTAEGVADRAAGRGIEVVDAAVSGGPHDIAAGRLTLFVGGSDKAVDRMRPVLDCYGDPVLHVGPLGTGQCVKLVNNALFGAQLGLISEAVRLASSLGVTEGVLLGALTHGSAASRALSGAAARESVARLIADADEFLSKDVTMVKQVVTDLGGDLGPLGPLLRAPGGQAGKGG